jgi:hypothetical protein
MGRETAPAHEVIARFKAQLREFVGTSGCSVTFPNRNGHLEILWEVYAALSPPEAAASVRYTVSWYPGDVLALTERGDGVLTSSVQIGNYGPPETRSSYSLRVGEEACVWTCDDNDFDLVVTEATFRVRARSPEVLERVVRVIVDWHAARGAELAGRSPQRV